MAPIWTRRRGTPGPSPQRPARTSPAPSRAPVGAGPDGEVTGGAGAPPPHSPSAVLGRGGVGTWHAGRQGGEIGRPRLMSKANEAPRGPRLVAPLRGGAAPGPTGGTRKPGAASRGYASHVRIGGRGAPLPARRFRHLSAALEEHPAAQQHAARRSRLSAGGAGLVRHITQGPHRSEPRVASEGADASPCPCWAFPRARTSIRR
jgi:hypothetical protein